MTYEEACYFEILLTLGITEGYYDEAANVVGDPSSFNCEIWNSFYYMSDYYFLAIYHLNTLKRLFAII